MLAPTTLAAPVDPVDRYVDATFERFHRALVAAAPGLPEPRVVDRARARRRLDLLVESLAGIAIGIVVGQVATAARRGLGADVRTAVEAEIARLARARPEDVPSPATFGTPDDVGVGMAAGFPHVLWPRLCGAVAIARALVRDLEAAIVRVAPAQHGAFVTVLGVLAADDASALAFADHLALGWAAFTALAAGTAPPADDDAGRARCAATWRAWSRRLAGHVAVAAPTVSPAEIGHGAILRVA